MHFCHYSLNDLWPLGRALGLTSESFWPDPNVLWRHSGLVLGISSRRSGTSSFFKEHFFSWCMVPSETVEYPTHVVFCLEIVCFHHSSLSPFFISLWPVVSSHWWRSAGYSCPLRMQARPWDFWFLNPPRVSPLGQSSESELKLAYSWRLTWYKSKDHEGPWENVWVPLCF